MLSLPLLLLLAVSGMSQSCTDSGGCPLSEVCRQGECMGCTTESQCTEKALGLTCEAGECVVRGLFSGTGIVRDLVVVVACVVVGFIAGAAGVGGGIVYVALFSGVLGMPHSVAAGLSSLMISGNISVVWSNLVLGFPDKTRVLPRDVLMMSLPIMMLGVVGGVFANLYSPSVLVVGALLVFLIVNVTRMTKKAIFVLKKDLAKAKKSRSEPVQPARVQEISLVEEDDSGIGPWDSTYSFDSEYSIDSTEATQSSESVYGPADKESVGGAWGQKRGDGMTRLPADLGRYRTVILLWLAVLVSGLARGDSKNDSLLGTPACGKIYWLSLAVLSIVLVVIQVIEYREWVGHDEGRTAPETKKNDIGMRLEFIWTKKMAWAFLTVSLASGVLASFVGVGGGILMSLFLVENNLDPVVMSAVVATVTTFSASSGAVLYGIAGYLPMGHSIVFGVLGVLSPYIGRKAALRMAGSNRSIFLFSLVSINIASLIITVLQMKRLSGESDGFSMEFGAEDACWM